LWLGHLQAQTKRLKRERDYLFIQELAGRDRDTNEPIRLWFGSTEWHPAEQWFIRALDIEKGEERDFALLDISFISGKVRP
jgi:hypothetical protein